VHLREQQVRANNLANADTLTCIFTNNRFSKEFGE